ncbi:Cytochrome P450, partial [Operophtera brumata]
MWMLVSRWQKRGMIKLWNRLRSNYKTLPFIGHAYMFLGSDEDRMKIFQTIGLEAYATGGLLAMWQGSRLY